MLDMAGNVEEWTCDLYLPYPGGQPVTDGFGGPEQYRVTRGGHWEGGWRPHQMRQETRYHLRGARAHGIAPARDHPAYPFMDDRGATG